MTRIFISKLFTFLFVILLVTSVAQVTPVTLAHDGEVHGGEQRAVPANARKAERTISTNNGQMQFSLVQLPADPRNGEEVEFEVRVVRLTNQVPATTTPVDRANITGQIKTINGQTLSSIPAHAENQPGVYGVHHTFNNSGDFKLLFDVTTAEGEKLTVDFPVAVQAAPVRYTPYLLDLALLAAGLWLIAARYRSTFKSDPQTATRRTLPYAAATLVLLVTSITAIHNLIPSTEPRVAAALPTEPLADPNTLTIPKESQLLFGIRTQEVAKERLKNGVTVTGIVRVQSQLKAEVVPLVAGRTRAAGSFTVGSYVKQGQTLAYVEQVLSAPDVADLEATRIDLKTKTAELQALAQQATTRRNAAEVELGRARRLYEAGIAPLKRVQEAEVQVKLAEQELVAAQQRAQITEMGEKRVEPIKTYPLQAPISGVIAVSAFTPGEQVEAGQTLFTIMNLDKVWIEAQVFEKDLATITSSKQATFKVAAFPDAEFQIGENTPNRLLTVGASVDPEKRTVPVVYEVTNPENRLRDGMSATITIDTSGDHETITVPKTAVIDEQGQKVVFVYKGGEQFARRIVTVGVEGQTSIEILTGLNPGERVVVEGIYQLRSTTSSGK